MSAAAIPNFDDYKPKKVDGNVQIPDFADYTPNERLPIGQEFTPSSTQRFFSHGMERAGGIVPGAIQTIKGLATHPIDTASNFVSNIVGTPKRIISMYQNGQSPEATEELAELALPLISKGAGALMERGATPLAESAINVGKKSRMFDAQPGKAVLRETGAAIRPAAVKDALQQKAIDLGQQLTTNAQSSSTPASLAPAIQPIADRMARASSAGATTTAEQLNPMLQYFQGEAPPGFAGSTIPSPTGGNPAIDVTQSPSQLLNMRREFNPNFRIKYGPTADSAISNTGKQAYRGMSNEVKRVVPGATELDPRIHDIMGALDPAESTSLNAGFGQRLMNRAAAHTGALAGGIAGYHYGGIPGAVAGIALPEIAASPTVQMAGAKSLFGLGNAAQNPAISIPMTIAGKGLPNNGPIDMKTGKPVTGAK